MSGFRFSLLFIASAMFSITAAAQPGNLTCGASVTTDTIQLESDLGPCPGNGLFINSSQTPVTINLNGHTIAGLGKGAGLKIGTSNGGVTVKGPGQIADFGTGIAIEDDDVLVYQVTLKANQVGIAVDGNEIRVV